MLRPGALRTALPLLATAVLTGSLIGPGVATAAPAEPGHVVTHQVAKTPKQLRAFWTPERLRQALARSVDGPAKAPDASANAKTATPQATVSAGAVPPLNGSPALDGGQASRPAASLASVTVSRRVSNVASWPQSAVGRLFYTDASGDNWYTCSATSISTANKNTIWTAGHCVHDGSGGDAGWHANLVFIPAYSLNSNPYGWWFGTRIYAHSKWTKDGDFYDSDMAAITVVPESGTAKLQDTVGGWGYSFGTVSGSTDYANARSYGYPVIGYNRPDSDFSDGEYMMYCEGNTVDAANLNPLDNRIRMTCDMGGGASGGPVAINTGSNPQIVGSNSHRNVGTNGRYSDNYLFSSNHGAIASTLIDAAKA